LSRALTNRAESPEIRTPSSRHTVNVQVAVDVYDHLNVNQG